METPTVIVLMAAYNGIKYIESQLHSVYGQRDVYARVFVRDDGSTDGTLCFLEAEQKAGRLILVRDDLGNIGPKACFARLVKAARDEAAFFAFCDQDDVWLPTLLSGAVQALSAVKALPALHTCRRTIVDERLRPAASSPRILRPGLGSALVENIVTGSGAVFTRPLARLLAEGIPGEAVMHDWWAYLLASAFGVVLWQDEELVLYRQHAQNVVGAQYGIGCYKERVWQALGGGPKHIRASQAAAFLAQFGPRLSPSARSLVEEVSRRPKSMAGRIRLAASGAVWRQSMAETLATRCMILADRV